MTLPFWFILVAIAVGIGGIWLALQTQWAEDRERRRIQIHQWALDEERAILKAAPTLYKGYRMASDPDVIKAQREYNQTRNMVDDYVGKPEGK